MVIAMIAGLPPHLELSRGLFIGRDAVGRVHRLQPVRNTLVANTNIDRKHMWISLVASRL